MVNGLIRETGVDPSLIEDLIVGTAFPEAEQGFNVARMITFLTDLPETVPELLSIASVAHQCRQFMTAWVEYPWARETHS